MSSDLFEVSLSSSVFHLLILPHGLMLRDWPTATTSKPCSRRKNLLIALLAGSANDIFSLILFCGDGDKVFIAIYIDNHAIGAEKTKQPIDKPTLMGS